MGNLSFEQNNLPSEIKKDRHPAVENTGTQTTPDQHSSWSDDSGFEFLGKKAVDPTARLAVLPSAPAYRNHRNTGGSISRTAISVGVIFGLCLIPVIGSGISEKYDNYMRESAIERNIELLPDYLAQISALADAQFEVANSRDDGSHYTAKINQILDKVEKVAYQMTIKESALAIEDVGPNYINKLHTIFLADDLTHFGNLSVQLAAENSELWSQVSDRSAEKVFDVNFDPLKYDTFEEKTEALTRYKALSAEIGTNVNLASTLLEKESEYRSKIIERYYELTKRYEAALSAYKTLKPQAREAGISVPVLGTSLYSMQIENRNSDYVEKLVDQLDSLSSQYEKTNLKLEQAIAKKQALAQAAKEEAARLEAAKATESTEVNSETVAIAERAEEVISQETTPEPVEAAVAVSKPISSATTQVTSNRAAGDLKKPEPIIRKYSLTIRPTPTDARVRILNIGPKYQDGLKLAPGSYNIEISKNGYTAQRFWIELKNRDRVLTRALSKAPKKQVAKAQTKPQETPEEKKQNPVGSFFKSVFGGGQ